MAFLALCRPRGTWVLHDALTWPGLPATAAPQGVRGIGLPMDDDGLLPDALEAACREHRPRLLYTMPTLHNPTTVVMSEERRQAIAAVARQHGVFVVEDDVYGFLLDQPLPPIRTFLPDLGVYVTSLSKCVAPALRIGYLAAAPSLLPRLAAAMRTSVLMTSSLAAEVASRAIASGAAAIAAGRQREEARARQQLAADLLQGLSYRSRPTAFHGWLPVPAPWRTDNLVAALAARGVSVTPGAAFAADGKEPQGETHVRLCLCAVPDRARLAMALGIVGEVLRGSPPQRLPVV
jgi:DNA-binding transcriptional MocR family regulator